MHRIIWSSYEPAHIHRLIGTFSGHLYQITFEDEQRKLCWVCTYSQTHLNLLWSSIPHTVCRWTEKALLRLHISQTHLNHLWPPLPRTFCRWVEEASLVRLHICSDSSEPSFKHFVDEQRKLGWVCTYAHTNLNHLWSPLSNTFCRWVEEASLVRLHICSDSSEPSFIHFVDGQRKLWCVCTYVHTHLNFCYSPIVHTLWW